MGKCRTASFQMCGQECTEVQRRYLSFERLSQGSSSHPISQEKVRVAIKVLRGAPSYKSELHERTREKLAARGAVWKTLKHPNINVFYGIVYDYGYLPALIIEWCSEGNILSYILSNQPPENDIHRLVCRQSNSRTSPTLMGHSNRCWTLLGD